MTAAASPRASHCLSKGASARPCRSGRVTPVQGFTLIEVLVVLVILGVAISGVSIGLDALRGRDDELALERLRWVLEATAERGRTRGQPIAFELLPDGYRFSLQEADGRWVAFESAPVFVERVFPASLAWAGLRVEGQRSERIVFGNRAPRFELQVNSPGGTTHLQGRPSGVVDSHRRGVSPS